MAAVGIMIVSGCVVRPDGRVEFAPVVVAPAPVVVAPAPAVEVTVGVPDDYVWDGYEYVGVVGDQYYYLGAGNAWMVMDPVRLGRFHTWEGGHADWRTHAIHNVKYRNAYHAPAQPMHDNGPAHDAHAPADHNAPNPSGHDDSHPDHNNPPQ